MCKKISYEIWLGLEDWSDLGLVPLTKFKYFVRYFRNIVVILVRIFISLFLLNSVAKAETCQTSAVCPLEDTNLLNPELAHTAATNEILAALSRCGNDAGEGGAKYVSEKKACVSSLFSCATDFVKDTAVSGYKAYRFLACTTTLTGIATCGSEAAQTMRQVAHTMNETVKTLSSLPPKTMQTVACSLSGEMGPELLLSSFTGPAGWARNAVKMEVLLARLKTLVPILKKLGLSDEAVAGVTKLDAKTLEDVSKLDDRKQKSIFESCAIGGNK